MSRHFELLNYSEHGTVVDNVIYCCDLDVELSVKSETDDTKEKRSSFPGFDDLLRRKGDVTTTDNFTYSEPKDVSWVLNGYGIEGSSLNDSFGFSCRRLRDADVVSVSALLPQPAKVVDGKAPLCWRMALTSSLDACNLFCVSVTPTRNLVLFITKFIIMSSVHNAYLPHDVFTIIFLFSINPSRLQ